MTLANILTSARIALLPVYAGATYMWLNAPGGPSVHGWFWVAFPLFFFLSATDAVDGALARWRNEETELGAWLDPTADKLLMLVSLWLLAPSLIPEWFLVVWFLREIVMLVGAWLMRTRIPQIDLKPRVLSKLATFLQFLVVGAAFLPIPTPWQLGLWIVTIAATVISGLLYMVDGFRQVYGDDWGRNRISNT